VSPIYAAMGPSKMMVRRHVTGALGLTGAEADEKEREIHAEHQEWRLPYLEDWLVGVSGTPEPPFGGVLDVGFAK
jgi:hypothetical protein